MIRLSLKARLAALVGVPLALLGAAMLAVSYGIVTHSLKAPLQADTASGHSLLPRSTVAFRATQDALVERTQAQLLGSYLVVMAATFAFAVVLGWLLATRILQALRRVAAVAEQVRQGVLGERVRMAGPRDELRELADTFDAMLIRLDAVFNAQRRFVADASHELRTPLTAMRAEIDVLCDDPHAAAADVRAATVVLRRQLSGCQERLDALLVLARSEPELLAREPVDLADLARASIEDAAKVLAARGLSVQSDLGSAPVAGDRRLLARLMSNLVGNAVQHNIEGGWVSVQTGLRGEQSILVVANSGPVVTSEELTVLTQPFRRGGQARTGDGYGLGLAIVDAVVRSHGGELVLENPAAGGLRITVALGQDKRPT